MSKPRKTPYTIAGICRVPCAHCGKPSSAQWSVAPCASRVGMEWKGLCDACDLEMNRMVMRFLQVEDWQGKMKTYKAAS